MEIIGVNNKQLKEPLIKLPTNQTTEPHYPKVGSGCKPMSMEMVLWISFLLQGYALSDPAAEETLYDIESMRRFAGLELGEDTMPDETTILNFRNLHKEHELTSRILPMAKLTLKNELVLSVGSIVDARSFVHRPQLKT